MRVFAAIVCIASSLPAQAHFVSALDARTGVASGAATPWLRESQLAPSVQATNAFSWLRVDGLLLERGGEVMVPHSAVRGAASLPAVGGGRFRLSLQFDATRSIASATRTDSLSRVSGFNTSAATTAAASFKLGRSGVWLGSIAGRTSDEAYSATRRPRLVAGAWRIIGSAVASLSVEPQIGRTISNRIRSVSDSIYVDSSSQWVHRQRTVIDTGAASRTVRLSNVNGRVDWTVGDLMFSATMAGRRSGDSARATVWGGVTTVAPIVSRVSLIAAIGSRPVPQARNVAIARYATLGLRLSRASVMREPPPAAVRPAASAFSLARVSADSFTVQLRVPGARTVELSGDFNAWKPLVLREERPNVWIVTVALTPGIHRMNVRVDGDAWTAPPGLPSVEDEFNGRVGILVVR